MRGRRTTSGGCPGRPRRRARRDLPDDRSRGSRHREVYADGAAQYGTRQAERYQDGLFDLFDLLADNPRLARERPEFTPPIRLHPCGAHLVVYTLDEAGVLIVRVLPGRADWERWLS